MKHASPQFIAPECSAPGCHHSGDPHTMVKCRACGHWFCEEHLASITSATLNERNERIAQLPTIKLRDVGAYDLTYYVGYCSHCLEIPMERLEDDSSWLR